MKNRLFILSIIAGCALSGAAQERMKIRLDGPQDFRKHEISGEITYKGQTFKIGKPTGKRISTATRADEDPSDPFPTYPPAPVTEVIKEAPGVEYHYCKDVVGYGGGLPIQGYSVRAEINWDGTDAYFRNILTAARMNTYVKASLQDDMIVVPMNQTVFDDYPEDEGYVLNLGLMRTLISDMDGDRYVYFEYSPDFDSLSYKIRADGGYEITSPVASTPLPYENCIQPSLVGWPDYVMGYYFSDDYLWNGYCDVFQIYDLFDYEMTKLPENAAELPMNRMSYVNRDHDGVIVNVYDAGDCLYFENMSPYAPGSVFKADFVTDETAGNRLEVQPNQYVGDEADMYYIITSTAYMAGPYPDLVPDTPAYFLYERDDQGRIVSVEADPFEEYFLTFNDDIMGYWDLDSFQGVKLTLQDSFAGTPSTPYNLSYEPLGSMMGSNWIFFNLSQFADNGDIIDTQNLYYRVYLNGDDEPWEFEPITAPNLVDVLFTMYYGLSEPTTLIPYNFSNGRDILKDEFGLYYVALYVDGIESVGVQAVYFWDGVETTSDIFTIETDSVESIQATVPVSVEYYDFQGRKVSNPGKGLYIRRMQLSDGTFKSEKVVLK